MDLNTDLDLAEKLASGFDLDLMNRGMNRGMNAEHY